jgi:hypothetical protein
MHKNRCATIRVFPYKLIKYLFLDRSIVVFWVVVPCSIVACYQHSGTYFSIFKVVKSDLKMEAVYSFKTLVITYKSTRSQHQCLHICENLKFLCLDKVP